MSPEENKALIRRFYEEIDAGNLDAMDELVAEDYVNHSPFPFPVPEGREGLKQAFKILWDATPGTHEVPMQIDFVTSDLHGERFKKVRTPSQSAER